MENPKFDAYTVTAIVMPGAALAFGFLLLFPELTHLLVPEGLTVGFLGVFLILAFVVGHLLQAIGNLLEAGWWRLAGGFPTNSVLDASQSLIAGAQRQQLLERAHERWGFKPEEHPVKDWFGVTRQMYATIQAAGRAERIDAFNADYGLNRGLAAAFLVIAAVAVLRDVGDNWPYTLGLLSAAGLACYRMHRRGRAYARELFVQYLSLD